MRVVRTMMEDGKSLLLRRNGEHLELVLGNVVLLSSAALETEHAFGRLARQDGAPPPRRVVIGGLGFGATLHGVLAVAGPDTEVVVVEKLACVIGLARAESAHLLGDALADPRVVVRNADVADVIAASTGTTAILLDVDNGPEWASFRTNARLYGGDALARALAALEPGGRFAVWSGYPADAFVGTLRKAGFLSSTIPLRERGVVRARAYVGTRPND